MAACAPPSPPRPRDTVLVPSGFPEAYYRDAAASGKPVLMVDSSHSLVTIAVRRDGSLAQLGHDHVVASHAIKGYVAPQAARADLYVRLDQLTVDEPGLRAEADLEPDLADEAIQGTRRNMLDKVLEAERFPFALIHVGRREGDDSLLDLAITLHGNTRSYEIPAQFEPLPGGLAVSGSLSFKQSDFGMVPMSVLGGALQVRDRLDLRFHIVAKSDGSRR